ncbi:MAG: peptidylprolyl isomerase [Nitrospiraceae bacterium]
MSMQFQKKDPRATVIVTKFGEIKIRFYPDDAPRHVDNFISLAEMGFYDGTLFHRVVPGFIIRGGDPLSKQPDRALYGTGGQGCSQSGAQRPAPQTWRDFDGEVPRDGDSTRDFNDNGSQFFIWPAP